MELKNYLHLYLGCEVLIESEMFMTGNVKDEIIDRLIEVNIVENTIECESHVPPITDIKLLLRPLGSMTEDENAEAKTLFYKLKEKEIPGITTIETYAAMTKLYLDKGFDLFGLIDAGLAIDRTKQTLQPP